MHTARQALIDHLDASKGEFGVSTVKAYAGEIQAAIKDPLSLQDLLPAVLVLLEKGSKLDGHGGYDINLLVVQITDALETQSGASDALLLAESLWDWLESNFVWTVGSAHYTINLGDGEVRTLMVDSTFSVLQLTLQLKEL